MPPVREDIVMYGSFLPATLSWSSTLKRFFWLTLQRPPRALNLTFYVALETTEKQGHHQVAGKVLRTLLGANSDANIDFVL